MPLEEPSWWYGAGAADARVRALKPVSRIYAWAAVRRLKNAEPYTPGLPVICVGNFTAGGTGKTPLSLLIARLLSQQDAKPAFLTRGYSGTEAGPVWADQKKHSAREVGDEPLLLAAAAPAMVARNRPDGAKAIEAQGGFTHIVMDDGLQNPSLAKSLTIAVVDGTRGLGNGEVIPAGPLRAPLDVQFDLVDAIVVNGGGSQSKALHDLRSAFPGPVLSAFVRPVTDAQAKTLDGANVIAYAGIGNPARFLASLEEAGATVFASRFFKDHHKFKEAEALELLELAQDSRIRLVTTAKDLVRLPATQGALKELFDRSEALPIEMVLEDRDRLRLIDLIAAA